MSVPVLNNP